jgi:hypothetical protein
MHTVHLIVKAFGGTSALAAKTGNAQQTVSYWNTRSPPEIPPLHRPHVLNAARKHGVDLPADAQAYLRSKLRTPKAETVKPARKRVDASIAA